MSVEPVEIMEWTPEYSVHVEETASTSLSSDSSVASIRRCWPGKGRRFWELFSRSWRSSP